MKLSKLKKLTASVMLMLSASTVWSKWIVIAESSDKTETHYIDPDKIKRNGNSITIWEVIDLKQTKDKVRSFRAKVEYDCKNERVRALSVSANSGNMASGEVLELTNSTGEWTDVPPGTSAATKMNLVCQ